MPLKFNTAHFEADCAYNAYPPPTPQPNAEAFPNQAQVGEQVVHLSAAMIDKLGLNGPFKSTSAKGITPPNDESLVIGLTQFVIEAKNKKSYTFKRLKFQSYNPVRKLRSFQVVAGARGAKCWVEFRPEQKAGKTKQYRLRIDFNPRKLGPDGIQALKKFLAEFDALGFDHATWLKTARISKIDIALDCVGVRPLDLIVHLPDVEKRDFIVRHECETEYLYRRTKYAGKREWKLLARVYDRGAKLVSQGKPPPFGDAPLTRLEFCISPNSKYMTLLALPGAACMIEKVRVAHVDAFDTPYALEWRLWTYVMKLAGPEKANVLCCRFEDMCKAFKLAWLVPKKRLFNPLEVWGAWGDVVAKSGLLHLISQD